MKVQQERLWKRLMAVAEHGRQPDGGVTRLSYTPVERQVKDLVAGFMREAGMTVREDSVGNLIGRREGTQPDAPAVWMGSHLDSVFHGGDFDGPLGVLAAIEAVQTLQEEGITTGHPIEVLAFTDEEGARFRFGMIGSRGVAGTLTQQELQNVDAAGVSIAQAMRDAGYVPEDYASAARPKGSVKAYVELHIEQGKVLESHDLAVGVVTGIAGPLWLKFTLTGEAGHAGTTPMNLRRDPLVAASFILQEIERQAQSMPRTVGTVGQISVTPGGVNIIPKTVEFTLDLRDVVESDRDGIEQAIRRYAEKVCSERGVHCQIELLQRVNPVQCATDIQQAAEATCSELGYKTMQVVSGAGHDGMILHDLCPVGMIFVRSKNGVSHDPAEYSSPEDCAAGASVLLGTVLKLAGQA